MCLYIHKLPPLLSICSISTKLLAIIMRIQAIIPSFGITVYIFHSAVETTSLGFMLRGRRREWSRDQGKDEETGLSVSIVQIRTLRSRHIEELFQDSLVLMVSWWRARNMLLNTDTGTLSTLLYFAQICLMTYNWHF